MPRRLLSLFTLAGVLAASTTASAQVSTLHVGVAPESLTKGWDGHYYVTMMGVRDDSDAAKTDGEVRMVTPRGQVRVIASGFDQPKGIVFSGEHLVFADMQTLWKINQAGDVSVLAGPDAFPVPPTFLNDVALDPAGRGVYVTEMGPVWEIFGPDGLRELDDPHVLAIDPPGRVYHVSWEGEVTTAIDQTLMMRFPNGLYVEPDGRILVCSFFLGDIIAAYPGQDPQIIATGHRTADGVETDDAGNLIVTEVISGQIFVRKPNGHAAELIHTASSAADHYLDRETNTLIVPDTAAGELVYIEL